MGKLEEAAFLRGKKEATEYLKKLADDKEDGYDVSVEEAVQRMKPGIKENIVRAREEGDEYQARNLDGWLSILKRH